MAKKVSVINMKGGVGKKHARSEFGLAFRGDVKLEKEGSFGRS
jgi:hypothetical protein